MRLKMKLGISNQWQSLPYTDLDIFTIRFSYFGLDDAYWHWTIQIGVVGFLFVIGVRPWE